MWCAMCGGVSSSFVACVKSAIEFMRFRRESCMLHNCMIYVFESPKDVHSHALTRETTERATVATIDISRLCCCVRSGPYIVPIFDCGKINFCGTAATESANAHLYSFTFTETESNHFSPNFYRNKSRIILHVACSLYIRCYLDSCTAPKSAQCAHACVRKSGRVTEIIEKVSHRSQTTKCD